jgi:hypothetical protein
MFKVFPLLNTFLDSPDDVVMNGHKYFSILFFTNTNRDWCVGNALYVMYPAGVLVRSAVVLTKVTLSLVPSGR